jgi:hypothetical protein
LYEESRSQWGASCKRTRRSGRKQDLLVPKNWRGKMEQVGEKKIERKGGWETKGRRRK